MFEEVFFQKTFEFSFFWDTFIFHIFMNGWKKKEISLMGWEEKAVSTWEDSGDPLEGSFQFASALTPQRCPLNLMLISTWEPMPCLFAHYREKGEETQWREKIKTEEKKWP